MADKRFGVRELIVLGSGTPTITSPGDLNLISNTLGISADVTIGGKIGLGNPVDYGTANQVLTSNGPSAAPTWEDVSGGVNSFTGLTDTPANYTNAGGKLVAVNSGANALEFIDTSTVGGTTYTLPASGNLSAVTITLTGSDSTTDPVTITAGNNIFFHTISAGGFTIDSTGSGGGGGTSTTKIAILQEKYVSGINGGTFTSGAWRDRVLTDSNDPESIVGGVPSLFTLEAGTYKINWSAPAHAVDSHQSKLLYADNNSFTNSSEKLGSSEACHDPILEGNNNIQTRSFGETILTLTQTTFFKIQHRCSDTQATNGFGVPAGVYGSSGNEIYTQVVIQDLSSGGGTGTLTDVDVKQYADENTPRTEYGCSNPIEVTVNAGIATIGIGSTSNAFGKRYVGTTAPTSDVCDGDIWYDTSPGSSGGFVTGMIMMFSGTTAPTGWVLCDNSTAAQAANAPDLRDRFIVGTGNSYNLNATGGSANAILVSHNHGAGTYSAQSDGNHNHTVGSGNDRFQTQNSSDGSNIPNSHLGGDSDQGDFDEGSATNTNNNGSHSHNVSGSSSTVGKNNTGADSTSQTGTNANLPPYYALAFIMKT